MRSIAYFPAQTATNSRPVIEAVLSSLRACGICTQQDSWTADAAVIWSVLWAGKMLPNQQVYQHYREQGKPVIIVEVGALCRGHTWKVCVNHTTADGYYGHQENLDWDRPTQLGINLAIVAKPSPDIVIALQHAQSLQVADLDQATWAQQQITELRKHTDRPICVRPHPRSRLNSNINIKIQQPRPIAGTYDSFDLDFNCHAVVNYNSAPGIQCAIAGCRPVVDCSSLARPVGIDMANIEKSYLVDRDQWLVEICHTEYTVEELQRGSWIKRIESAL